MSEKSYQMINEGLVRVLIEDGHLDHPKGEVEVSIAFDLTKMSTQQAAALEAAREELEYAGIFFTRSTCSVNSDVSPSNFRPEKCMWTFNRLSRGPMRIQATVSSESTNTLLGEDKRS